MKSSIVFIGDYADVIKSHLRRSDDVLSSDLLSHEDLKQYIGHPAGADYKLVHMLVDFSSKGASSQFKDLVSSMKERGITAVIYPLLPFVSVGDDRQEAEAGIQISGDSGNPSVPIDMELALEYCADMLLLDALSLFSRNLYSAIELVGKDIVDNGIQSDSRYESIVQSVMRTALSKAKDENDKKMQEKAQQMQSEFARYIKTLTKCLDKGNPDLVIPMLPMAMDSPYYLSDENARLIGMQLNSLSPILNRLQSDPVIYKTNKVRIEGVRKRLNIVLAGLER